TCFQHEHADPLYRELERSGYHPVTLLVMVGMRAVICFRSIRPLKDRKPLESELVSHHRRVRQVKFGPFFYTVVASHDRNILASPVGTTTKMGHRNRRP